MAAIATMAADAKSRFTDCPFPSVGRCFAARWHLCLAGRASASEQRMNCFELRRSGDAEAGCALAALGTFLAVVDEALEIRLRARRVDTARVTVVLDEARLPTFGTDADRCLQFVHHQRPCLRLTGLVAKRTLTVPQATPVAKSTHRHHSHGKRVAPSRLDMRNCWMGPSRRHQHHRFAPRIVRGPRAARRTYVLLPCGQRFSSRLAPRKGLPGPGIRPRGPRVRTAWRYGDPVTEPLSSHARIRAPQQESER